jgi:ABC-type cobalamin/Fe3+-siderophores transport system ATPase subunit/5S rRNA maturation endonuclease (ribonuclease M5)
MKIQELKIEGYKNIDINLIHKSDIIALIGRNGSGKSNILEAISYIFRSLYNPKETVPFDYIIEYQNSVGQNIRIENERSKKLFFLDGKTQVSINDYLPKKLIAIYSGEENRLWSSIYQPIYEDFIASINRSEMQGLPLSQLMPRMLYINKFYWNISLLSLAISDSEDNINFIKEILKINQIEKVKFDFKKGNYENYSNSLVLDFIRTIDEKTEYTVEELKDVLNKKGYIPDDVFQYLYIAFTPKNSKIIDSITIKYNEHLVLEDLSEGEKKLLLVKAAFEFAEQEDSLFVLDEPDAHVHINNKQQIIRAFEPYKGNRQIILTTHSPTITKCLEKRNLYMLDSGQIIEKKKESIIEDLVGELWNKHQQNIFLTSDKPIILFVEGEEDKLHISKAFEILGEEYPELEFDIFKLNGADNIEHLLKGLYTSEFGLDKMYIGIFDFDEKGEKVIKGLKSTFNDNSGFNVIMYPKRKVNNKHKGGFTVENMFDITLYKKAYDEIIKDFVFDNCSINKISENIQKKAKGRLTSIVKQLEKKEDFSNFRFLFEKINDMFLAYKSAINKESEKENIEKDEKEEMKRTVWPPEKVFYIKRKGIRARGIFHPDTEKFTLLPGSQATKEYVDSIKENYKEYKHNLIKSVKHREGINMFTILEQIEFDSPSGAAKFVNGGTLNGWIEWKNKDGKTLDEIYRKVN